MRQLALRVYRDIVRRRSTVRIHQAHWQQPLAASPAFLLGLYRSGTTPIRYSLAMHPSIAAPPESDFLVSFLRSIRDDRSTSGLATLGFDRDHVTATYRQAAMYFFANYAGSISDDIALLVDKTPSYVDYADELCELFPDSRFLVLTRHPFGQIGSSTRYGRLRPEIPDFPAEAANSSLLEDAARYWVERTSTLLRLCEDHPDKVLLCRYEDLCVEPERSLRASIDFLQVPWDDRVLSYDGNAADRGREGAKALAHKGFESSMAEPLRGWSESAEHLDKVWRIVEPVARTLGYTKNTFCELPR